MILGSPVRICGLSGLKDGGVVRGGRDAMSDEESRKEFSRTFNQPG